MVTAAELQPYIDAGIVKQNQDGTYSATGNYFSEARDAGYTMYGSRGRIDVAQKAAPGDYIRIGDYSYIVSPDRNRRYNGYIVSKIAVSPDGRIIGTYAPGYFKPKNYRSGADTVNRTDASKVGFLNQAAGTGVKYSQPDSFTGGGTTSTTGNDQGIFITPQGATIANDSGAVSTARVVTATQGPLAGSTIIVTPGPAPKTAGDMLQQIRNSGVTTIDVQSYQRPRIVNQYTDAKTGAAVTEYDRPSAGELSVNADLARRAAVATSANLISSQNNPNASYGTGYPSNASRVSDVGGPTSLALLGIQDGLQRNKETVDQKRKTSLTEDFYSKAFTYEQMRQAATNPRDEAKFTVLGGAYAYGGLFLGGLSNIKNKGKDFVEGLLVGSATEVGTRILSKNTAGKVVVRGGGAILGGVYVASKTNEFISEAPVQYSSPYITGPVSSYEKYNASRRQLGYAADFVATTTAELGGFAAGQKTTKTAIDGGSFKVPGPDNTYVVDYKPENLKLPGAKSQPKGPVFDVGIIPNSIARPKSTGPIDVTPRQNIVTDFLGDRMGEVGGRSARDRSGRMSKAEMRERKAPMANAPKYEVVDIAPNTQEFNLRGKARARTDELRLISATVRSEPTRVVTFFSESNAYGIVSQNRMVPRITLAEFALPGEHSPRITPAPGRERAIIPSQDPAVNLARYRQSIGLSAKPSGSKRVVSVLTSPQQKSTPDVRELVPFGSNRNVLVTKEYATVGPGERAMWQPTTQFPAATERLQPPIVRRYRRGNTEYVERDPFGGAEPFYAPKSRQGSHPIGSPEYRRLMVRERLRRLRAQREGQVTGQQLVPQTPSQKYIAPSREPEGFDLINNARSSNRIGSGTKESFSIGEGFNSKKRDFFDSRAKYKLAPAFERKAGQPSDYRFDAGVASLPITIATPRAKPSQFVAEDLAPGAPFSPQIMKPRRTRTTPSTPSTTKTPDSIVPDNPLVPRTGIPTTPTPGNPERPPKVEPPELPVTLPGFDFGGRRSRGGRASSSDAAYGYTPSFFALSMNLRGKASDKSVVSGLGIRPIDPGKNDFGLKRPRVKL